MISELFNNPFSFIVFVAALLISLSVHEFAHAFVADRLGDPTARLSGRLTLNPLAHLDPFGLLFLLIVGFGWGKPVPFDPFNLKKPLRDSALIALAGPTSNLILASLLSIILRAIPYFPFPHTGFLLIQAFFVSIVVLNVRWAIFNLLPINPLDGFKVVSGFLPRNLAYQWQELEGFGLFFLLLLILPLANGPLLINILNPITSLFLNFLLPGLGTII